VAQLTNRSLLDFEAQIKKPSRWFWGPHHETVAAGFEDQTEKSEATGFEIKLGEIVATGFKAKPVETVLVVLKPNHW
jgi:hypothetical protein